MKRIFLILVIFLSTANLFAQVDTVTVFDFSTEWMFYDGNSRLPLVRKADFEGNIILFEVDRREWVNSFLTVDYPEPFSLFIDGKLFSSGSNNVSINFKSIASKSNRTEITVYSETLNPFYLNTRALKIIDNTNNSLGNDVVIVEPRIRDAFQSFFIIASIVVLIYFTVLYTFYPRSLAEYFSLTRAISPRELDENLIKTRPFTGINISIYIFISLIVGLLIYSVIHLANLFPEELQYYPDNSFLGLLYWLKLSVNIFALIFLKYILISVFSNLFVINEFVSSHFYNSIRLLFMISVLLMLGTGFLYYGFVNNHSLIYYGIYSTLLYSIPFISLIIYLKLMNSAGYKKLHLFSYLCGTELIPYVIILSLGIN